MKFAFALTLLISSLAVAQPQNAPCPHGIASPTNGNLPRGLYLSAFAPGDHFATWQGCGEVHSIQVASSGSQADELNLLHFYIYDDLDNDTSTLFDLVLAAPQVFIEMHNDGANILYTAEFDPPIEFGEGDVFWAGVLADTPNAAVRRLASQQTNGRAFLEVGNPALPPFANPVAEYGTPTPGGEVAAMRVLANRVLPCGGNTNADWNVDVQDLLRVIVDWGDDGSSTGDVTNDGVVDVSDLLEVILHWGPCW